LGQAFGEMQEESRKAIAFQPFKESLCDVVIQ
jgi:hypothetical protein